MTFVVALLATTAFAFFSLLDGAEYLERLLPGGLPVGNALTALGMCSAAAAALTLSPQGTVLRLVCAAALAAGAAWLPVSIALAGNLALELQGTRGLAWIGIIRGTIAGILLALVWALVHTALAWIRRTR